MNRLQNMAVICSRCGKPFGFHGAKAPHDCPTEQVSPGRWADPTTTFKPEKNMEGVDGNG